MARIGEKRRAERDRGQAESHAGQGARERGLACAQCGLVLETPALRCPRCLAPITLGCGGDCRACGKSGC